MSYAMTHLIIANEYAKRNEVGDRGLFLIANISPDSIHERPDYDKSMKERSHFLQENTPWGSIYQDEQMVEWYRRLNLFYTERKSFCVLSDSEDMAYTYLNGYAMHILVDIYNCKYIYAPNLIKNGYNEEFRRKYREQCLMWDAYLYHTYPESGEMMELMEAALEHIADGTLIRQLKLNSVIRPNEIMGNFQYNRNIYETSKMPELDGLYMLSREKSDQFITEVTKECERIVGKFPAIRSFYDT